MQYNSRIAQPKHPHEWELYNMENDRTEVNNLASSLPELRDKMILEWTRRAHETNALPWPDKSKSVLAPFDLH